MKVAGFAILFLLSGSIQLAAQGPMQEPDDPLEISAKWISFLTGKWTVQHKEHRSSRGKDGPSIWHDVRFTSLFDATGRMAIAPHKRQEERYSGVLRFASEQRGRGELYYVRQSSKAKPLKIGRVSVIRKGNDRYVVEYAVDKPLPDRKKYRHAHDFLRRHTSMKSWKKNKTNDKAILQLTFQRDGKPRRSKD